MSHGPLDVHAQRRKEVERMEKEKRETREELDDIRWLMGNKRGRRMAGRLLERSGVTRSVFHQTAMVMAMNEGVRNFGLQFLDLINIACPEQYLAMLKERLEDERKHVDDGSGKPND